MGSVATKASELGAAWVILDRRLKKEGDFCLKQLADCNIILIDHAIPKIIRLANSRSQPSDEIDPSGPHNDPTAVDMSNVLPIYHSDSKTTTTPSSLGLDSQSANTDEWGTISSEEREDDRRATPFVANYQPSKSLINQNESRSPAMSRLTASSTTRSQELRKVSKFDGDDQCRSSDGSHSTASSSKPQELTRVSKLDGDEQYRSPTKPRPTASSTKSHELRRVTNFSDDDQCRSPAVSRSTATRARSQELKWVSKFNNGGPTRETPIDNYGNSRSIGVKQIEKLKPPKVPIPARRSADIPRPRKHLDGPDESNALINSRRSFSREIKQAKAITVSSSPRITAPLDRTSSIRRAISISIKQPPTPPPLCSVCKHNAPIFGKPPRKFSYAEMEAATDGFSNENFLAEGGYGPVYKGVLADGQVVAVKQHKMVSAQGASEFCAEVEVLSCAQHRNLVMLVGYCMEEEWLLVYEFACNGSLNNHLYGKESKEVMAWKDRLKVAIGAARGLRYLHEDCRVGCIVHRDLRPNNILLTHDFEPMVGDFGLARWQADGDSAEETRVVGTLGYLAPEYTRTGQITEKADVYAFGVLLMELVSGLKAIDFSRTQGRQYLPEWGRPMVEKKMVHQMIDPRLDSDYIAQEVECMMHAASLCIKQDPERRPRMSKVLRILEGDMLHDIVPHDQLQHARTWTYTDLAPSIPQRSPISNDSINKATSVRQRSTDMYGMERASNECWMSGENDSVLSEEFQTYLQGSFSEFMQKMKSDEKAMALMHGDGYQKSHPISKTSIKSM
ncbi:inactive protein kinase SELMODRAFT_444075-like [Magnolia sinica]|uniref:inactive protein kinase SELMODRAFT_444075-like n=1 Tax=Magnolia sinica TaxID=86752 RepID=UPI002658E9F4|nr:inactive protein kinase SELMODRAFT_444075-like [Magnolia sinica]